MKNSCKDYEYYNKPAKIGLAIGHALTEMDPCKINRRADIFSSEKGAKKVENMAFYHLSLGPPPPMPWSFSRKDKNTAMFFSSFKAILGLRAC